MAAEFLSAIPVLPAVNVEESLRWWTEVCGFREIFRTGEPPVYAGIGRGDVLLHLTAVEGDIARTVGEQTMVRLQVTGIEALYAEYREHGGVVHPNAPLREQPWGGRAFGAVDPNGVCISFTER